MQVGCGADELIDLLMRCVLDPGDSIIDCPPTFTMYKFDAAVNDANVITVLRKDDFSIDVQGNQKRLITLLFMFNAAVQAMHVMLPDSPDFTCRYNSCSQAAQPKNSVFDFPKQPRWQSHTRT